MMPGDLVKRVVEACRWGAGGEAKGFGEGVLRLMGAGYTTIYVGRESCCGRHAAQVRSS